MFRKGATFEMRTVLYKICLFNDKLIMQTNHAVREQDRERERESVCERDRALLEMRDGIGNKMDCYRKYLWQMREINLR